VTALFWIWVVLGVILFIVSLCFLGYYIYMYWDARDTSISYRKETAHDVLVALVGPPAAILWPLTLTVGILYGGYVLTKSLIRDLKNPKQETK
jgi:uncharacterized protein YneF (UPF0154 family)